MTRGRSPTIKDVAKVAGVSSATVSYVLNDLNKVTPEVDALVRRVAKAHAPKSWEWVVGKGLSPLTPYNFGCYRRTAHRRLFYGRALQFLDTHLKVWDFKRIPQRGQHLE